MNKYLQELVGDFERTLARSGFGVTTHTSTRALDREGTTLVFVGPDGIQRTYRFEFREVVEDEGTWIAALARQLTSECLTAIYAVTPHVFSAQGEQLASRFSVGLHEVASGIRNRVVTVSTAVKSDTTSRVLPPLILTQRLKSGPAAPRWTGNAKLSDDKGPVMDLLFEADRDSDGKVHVRKREVPLRPDATDVHMQIRPAQTGTAGLPECYARHLGSCNGLSREHVISESVLKLLPGEGVIVTAAPGLPADRSYKTGVRALKWPILCEKHNILLSEVDKDGAAFFSIINDALNGRTPAAGVRASFVGTRLERWLLKVACGVTAAEARRGVMGDVPIEWVQILFGARPWPSYFSSFWAEREGVRSHEYGFEVVTTIDSVTGRPKGITLSAFRLSVVLALGAFDGVPGLQRPAGFAVGLNDFAVDLELIWPGQTTSAVAAAQQGVAADGASPRR